MIEKPCLQWGELDPRICPEPGNCDKCQIPMAECSYWWMVENEEETPSQEGNTEGTEKRTA